jgi:hypothetical protein
MSWIPSHQELSRHPKTLRLARQLGQSLPETIGQLHLLWYWSMDFAQDGDLTKHDFADVSHAMMSQVHPEKLRAALLESGFLDEEEGSLLLHDWNDYGGKLILEKRAEAQRKKERRKKAEMNAAPCPPDVRGMSAATVAPVPETSAPAVTSVNDRNFDQNQALEADFSAFSCPPDVRGMSAGREEESTEEESTGEEIREERRRSEQRREENGHDALDAALVFHTDNGLPATASHEGVNGTQNMAQLTSPLAMAVREVCCKSKTLSPRDSAKLAYVLMGLKAENATVEQVQEFGRKCKTHWIGRDSRTKEPRAPGITQVLEHWQEVLHLPEPQRVKSWKELDEMAAKFERR